MGEYLTERHIAEFKDAYMLIVKQKEKAINSANLGQMMRVLGMSPSDVELKDMINEVDADGSGDIDFPEFLSMMARRKRKDDMMIEIDETFRLFDKDKDGLISSRELKNMMIEMGEDISDDEIQEIMAEADQSGSGYINIEDFRTMFDTLLPPIN